jgi:DNA gyrase subunit B
MEYNAKSIERLTFREGCRKRIGIYLGSADRTGVLAGLLELVNNATDEALVCPTAKTIELVIGPDWASCRDYGRGMPHGPNDFTEEVMIDLLTENHSGAKFDDNAYGGKSRGLNGTGSAATCCSSDIFKITSYRDGAKWYMEFKEGIPLYEKCVREELNGEKGGTYIWYKPSQEVFSAEPIHFNYEEICKTMKEYSYFNKGITFIVTNAETNEVNKYMSKNGLADFAKDHIQNPIGSHSMHYSTSENDIDIEIIMQWTKGKEKFYLFSNGGENPDGGTPITGIKTAVTTFMKKQFKGEFDNDLMRKGLVYICAVNLKNPMYDGQTKSKITNPELRGLAQRVTGIMLNEFANRHPNDFKAVIDALTAERKAEAAAERARRQVLDNVKEVASAAKKGVFDVDKLADAENLGESAVLLLVEGKSAGGAMQRVRDPKKYGILKLRGKIINALSNDFEDVMRNEEVKLFLKATGLNISNYHESKLRYGKVAICVDADDDGMHIACLIIALLYRLAPEFLKEGRLCWLHAPLFKVTSGKTTKYFYDEQQLTSANIKGTQTRFKGLGEMKDEDARCMFDNNQWLETLEWDASVAMQIEALMGKDSQPKKDFVFSRINFEELEE